VRRNIPILRGLAILSVVLNHANWHVLSQYSRGELGGFFFVVVDQIGKFAIAAFLVIAGYFIAYATSRGKRDLAWGVVRARITGLVWPWLIWSLILVVGHRLNGSPLSLVEYLRTLVTQYYFVPLLIFYYLLAPWIARMAKNHPGTLLIVAAAAQLFGIALFYARVYWSGFPGVWRSWIDLGPVQYLRFAVYFPFGVVCGVSFRSVKETLLRFKMALPWCALITFVLSVVEASWVYTAGGQIWPLGGDQTKLTSALFCFSLVLCFVAYDRIKVPAARIITDVGTHSYGLYLAHYPILGIAARVVQRLFPWIVRFGGLYLPVLFFLTVAVAMLLMESVARLPTKRLYRYLFG
jgi:peptidoglycan/LPS O-acetylase OafA/YrhL